MTSSAGVVRRLLLLVAAMIACAVNPSTSFAAANTTDPSGSDGWRPDLNWGELESKLSSSAVLIDTSFINYRDECVPEFYEERATNLALIDQPSGVCLPHLLNGWDPESWFALLGPSLEGGTLKPLDTVMGFEGSDDTTPSPIADDESNLRLNLPSKVVFPANASDVFHIILFAMKNHIELSVKNSGHSYTSSSSKRNTLLVNMNRFTQYASGGITDCVAALLDTTVADDLSNQACLLALARGKPGVIRVGGGENFDKLYRAVIDENKALDAYKYHVVGGAAGTVSPNGWTFQGGNAGTMGGRIYGMGVDQVLQVEMVLPNGYHVKFGPTEWEDASAEGFAVPRTKVVSGVCRNNPDEHDEEKWIWGACPEDFDIDFGDLWFAVRGGGGGTWGVVTSMSLQLNDYLPYNKFQGPTPGLGDIYEECMTFLPKWHEFEAKYYMAPSLLNVTKERSLACGLGFYFECYGEEDVMQAWTNFLELNNSTEYAACLEHVVDSSSDESPKSYAEAMVGENPRFPGEVQDSPAPSLIPGGYPKGHAFVLVPQSWIDESEENIDILIKNSVNPGNYHAYGVDTYSFSDQADSLPQTLREAATMSIGLSTNEYFWSDLFPKMYDISDKTKFPAVFQSNHVTHSAHGPLKDDWTKVCPLEWTVEERKEKCISAQEAVYGTELLRRLEAIKMKVDPGFMLNCTSCVGNDLDVAKAPEAEAPLNDNEPSSVAVDEPSGASVASTFAAAISATLLCLYISLF